MICLVNTEMSFHSLDHLREARTSNIKHQGSSLMEDAEFQTQMVKEVVAGQNSRH